MIRVLMFEDNALLRDGLMILLRGTEGFELAGSYPDCSDIVEHCKRLKPDVILMDINIPNVDGLEGLRQIRAHDSEVKILMLTVFDDNQNVFDAIKNGANGYVLKRTPPARLLEYIHDVYEGGAPMTSSIAAQVLKMVSQPASVSNKFELSERETMVLNLLVKGHSYKMIAADLFISIDTVRSHIKKIYDKMHVNS